jgi:hypothetical protein
MRKALAMILHIGAHATFPLWIKFTAILFLCVFIVTNWSNYGLLVFLWFSCIGLIGAVLALWLESRILASMMLLMTIVADEVAWGGDFLFRLLVGWHPLGATRYMFDQRISMFVRAISFYHLVVPVLLVWMVYKLRYDPRAFAAQTLFCTVILMFSYTLSEPANNINCVFGLGAQPQSYVHPWLYLAAVMVYVPVAFYLPVHLLLRKLGWDQTRV